MRGLNPDLGAHTIRGVEAVDLATANPRQCCYARGRRRFSH